MAESLSRYVGKAWWSALFLALSDFYIIYQLWKFSRGLHSIHKMPKIWWTCCASLTIGLIGLSLCPLGLFDADISTPGIVSNCHEFFSRLMFVSMIFAILGIAIAFGYKSKTTLIACLAYLTYSCFFVGAYFAHLQLYDSFFFIWENLFLYGFFFTLLTVPSALTLCKTTKNTSTEE